jgi:hypothetical protein
MLSTLCHLHGLLWKRVSQSQNHREGPFWEQEPLIRDADYSAMWAAERGAWQSEAFVWSPSSIEDISQN